MKKSVLKKAACVLLTAALIFSLSSCMAMETGLVFNEDGTVRLFADTTVEEDMLTEMEMTKEDFLSSLNESETSEEYAGFSTEVVEKTVDGKIYVGQRYFKDMTLDELNAYSQNADENIAVSYSAVKEKGNLLVTITYTNNTELSDEEKSEMGEYLAQGMMTTTQSVIAPYEIVETNGIIDNETGKITWDTLDVMTGTEKEAVYTVTYKLPASPLAGIIIVAAVVAAAIVIVVLVFVIKGNKKNELPMVPYTPPQETAAPEQTAPAQPEAQSDEAVSFCRSCGAKLQNNDVFCAQCGEKV